MLSCTASLLDSVNMWGVGEGLWLGLDVVGRVCAAAGPVLPTLSIQAVWLELQSCSPTPTQSRFLRLKEGSQLFLEGHLLWLCFPPHPTVTVLGWLLLKAVLGGGMAPHCLCCGAAVSGCHCQYLGHLSPTVQMSDNY